MESRNRRQKGDAPAISVVPLLNALQSTKCVRCSSRRRERQLPQLSIIIAGRAWAPGNEMAIEATQACVRVWCQLRDIKREPRVRGAKGKPQQSFCWCAICLLFSFGANQCVSRPLHLSDLPLVASFASSLAITFLATPPSTSSYSRPAISLIVLLFAASQHVSDRQSLRPKEHVVRLCQDGAPHARRHWCHRHRLGVRWQRRH